MLIIDRLLIRRSASSWEHGALTDADFSCEMMALARAMFSALRLEALG